MAQEQHKIPRVYLRQFGYRDVNNHWKIEVTPMASKITETRNIKTFSAVTDIFTINSDDPRIVSLFEDTNGLIETEYPRIIAELNNNGFLGEKSYAFLLHLIPNLMVRSDHWRDFTLGILNSENKGNFLKSVLAHRALEEGQLQTIEEWIVFQNLYNLPANESVNRVLMFFMEHLLNRIGHGRLVFFRSQPNMPWFTTDNPISVKLVSRPYEVFTIQSEIYFVLSPTYMVYLYMPILNEAFPPGQNPLKYYPENTIHLVDVEQSQTLQNLILDNPSKYLIHPFIPPQ